jgi:iron-sulfur cluster repair protein YtfE (RIC family)
MENIRDWLFANTPIDSLLKTRPLSISVLEKNGIDPWKAPKEEIGDCCRDHRVPWETFSDEMKKLAAPAAGTDWQREPVYRLIDFLTREHREFLGIHLPAIQEILRQRAPGSGDWECLARLREGWQPFVNTLTDHIKEEEGFLFPTLMHYDYCLRHKTSHPDFSQGSVNVFIAIKLIGNEWKLLSVIRSFLEEAGFMKTRAVDGDSGEARLFALIEKLQARLQEHSQLETGVLYPMARKIEKALYDAHISGGSRETAWQNR